MKTFDRVAGKAVVAAIIIFSATATSMAGGASVPPAPKSAAHAVHANTTKTITCVKGKLVKKVTGTNPKCPAGWSPVYTTYTFKASYSGNISILWNTSGPTTATITGTGKGTEFGLAAITGSGSTTATAQVDPINGTGVLKGTAAIGTLHLKFATHSTATATDGSAPTTVIISGNATVTSGTGKFAGATGTLAVAGSFSIKSTSGSEKDAFGATLKGVVKVQK